MLSIDHLLMSRRMTDFGKNLTELRKARNLTQIELANLLDVQPRLLGRWERGQGKPQFDYIVKLADVLEVSIDRLVRGAEDPAADRFEIRNRKLKELCKQVDQLKPDEQDVICHFLALAVRHERLKELVGPIARRAG